jgi:hypothetical protein
MLPHHGDLGGWRSYRGYRINHMHALHDLTQQETTCRKVGRTWPKDDRDAQGYTRLHKVTQGYTRLHKVTQGYTAYLEARAGEVDAPRGVCIHLVQLHHFVIQQLQEVDLQAAAHQKTGQRRALSSPHRRVAMNTSIEGTHQQYERSKAWCWVPESA